MDGRRATLTNFTLEGEALRVTGMAGGSGTGYAVELLGDENERVLTYGQLCGLCERLLADIHAWDGVLAESYGGMRGCDVIRRFEETWKGGGGDDQPKAGA